MREPPDRSRGHGGSTKVLRAQFDIRPGQRHVVEPSDTPRSGEAWHPHEAYNHVRRAYMSLIRYRPNSACRPSLSLREPDQVRA